MATLSAAGIAHSEIPASWVGELLIEQDVPSFSPATGAVLAAKNTGKVEIRAGLPGIEGRGELPYESSLSAGGCSGEGEGTWNIVVSGQKASTTPALAPTQLEFRLERSASVIINMRCPGGPPQPPSRRSLPATTQLIRMPFADGEGWSTERAIGPGVLGSKVTLKLPCSWDARLPPGAKVRFEPDPRRVSLYSGAFDDSLTGAELTRLGVGRYLPSGSAAGPSSSLPAARGGTVWKWFTVPRETTSAVPVKTGRGFCVFSDELVFRLLPLKQYVAREVAAIPGSQCLALVLAHERKHAQDNQQLLAGAATQLENEMRAIPGIHDANLGSDPLDASRLETEIFAAAHRVEELVMRAHSELASRHDDQRSPENARIAEACRGVGR